MECGLQLSQINTFLWGYKQQRSGKMSSCGAGRGRGWLNLPKNSEPVKPMGLSQPPINNAAPSPQTGGEHKELIDRIKEINLCDDGIAFNRKLNHVKSYWMQNCSTKEEVETSFDEVYNVALHESVLGIKLVALLSAHNFKTEYIHDCHLRAQFLRNLQRDFDNREQLQSTSSLLFRNYVQMLGEFYSKITLSHGEPYKILAAPLFYCLEMLLNSKVLPDLIVFTNQLFLHGSNLKSQLVDDFQKLGIKIRMLLAEEAQLVTDAKLWLLLALDLFNVRFGILPTDVYKYYESQLGSAAMFNFQRPHDVLSIQTLYVSKVLDSYQSPVSVLQISTSPTEAPQNDIQNAQYINSNEYNGTQQNNSFAKDSQPKSKEKTGRPILGAGARFIKKGNEDTSFLNGKQTSSGRTPSSKHPPSLKSNKGWEHDDRFENDYN